MKQKGVKLTEYVNTNVNKEAMNKCIKSGETTEAENYILRSKDNRMTKQIQRKLGISGVNTKSVVMENGACLPFVYGVPSTNYDIKN